MTTANLVDLNDFAVNSLREYASERGYNVSALYAAEVALITTHGLDLDGYLKFRRTGSKFRMTRAARRHVFTAMTTRVSLQGAY